MLAPCVQALEGPIYPPVGGSPTLGSSGTGTATTGTGKTRTYSGMAQIVAANQELYWGPWSGGGITAGLDGTTSALNYDATDSNLAAGLAVWSGTGNYLNTSGTPVPLWIRFQVQASTIGGGSALPWTLASAKGISDPTVGALLSISGDFQVNFLFTVCTTQNGTYTPLDDFYNATPHLGGVSTTASFSAGFYYTPPLILAGPSYPPPGGTPTLGSSGTGTATTGSGKTRTYSDMAPIVAANQELFWGPTAGGITAGLDGTTSALNFDATDSILAAGFAVWSGTGNYLDINGNPVPVWIRFQVQASTIGGGSSLPWTLAAPYGIGDPTVGVILPISSDYRKRSGSHTGQDQLSRTMTGWQN
jgi:hypothetical protein